MIEPRWRRYLRFWKRDLSGDVDDERAFHLADARIARTNSGRSSVWRWCSR
jgi:hypothetical protein